MLQCGTDEQLKIELLSQWKLEAEFRNYKYTDNVIKDHLAPNVYEEQN